MEDRYLFRGKRIDNGEWVQGNLVHSEDSEDGWETLIIPTVESNMFTKGGSKGNLGFENWYKVDKDTLCQCTGLKDKSGKLIWENDIVNMRCNGLSGYGTVIYINGCYWIDDKKRGRQYPFSNHDVKYRVDGNVFDNPKLLEVQV